VASFQLIALALADNLFLALWFIHYSLRFVLRFAGGPVPPVLTYVRVTTFAVLYTAQTWTIWLAVAIICIAQTGTTWLTIAMIHRDYQRLACKPLVIFVNGCFY